MLRSFGVLCGGDYGGVVAAREIADAVRMVDRRAPRSGRHRSWAHNLCLESDCIGQTFHSSEQRGKGFSLVLSNDVDEAESRDRELVGDEATGGKPMKGTPDEDMTER